MRELPHPAVADIELPEVMHALADPVRLEMVRRLAQNSGDENCIGVTDGITIHKSTVSHHFRVLRESGVTETRVDGRNRYVQIRRAALEERFPGLLDAVLKALES
ncbi:MAG TPA: helix-turn-helix domain-containing protein [Glycomyces sp.]